MTTSRIVAERLMQIAGGVMIAAYVGVCIQARTAWPFSVVVHEDGRRTLLQTILYFEHATRELPIDLLLAIAIAGAVLHFFPVNASTLRRRHGLTWAAILVIAVMLAGALISVGWSGLLENFMQMPTRDGVPLVVGAHWRYHVLDRVACMLLAFALAGALAPRILSPARPAGGPMFLFWGALAGFAVLTVVFGLTLAPFVDPVVIGHQARELATHMLVTVPFGLGATLMCGREMPVSLRGVLTRCRDRDVIVPGLVSVVAGVYLAVAVVLTGATHKGQTDSTLALVFPHFFEHTFSYVLVAVASPALYLWTSVRDA